MKQKEMEKLTNHFDRYFEQSDCVVLHPLVDVGYHIDVLLYKPNQKYPFWKMVTMGASDYKMPDAPNSVSQYNEYIMFVDAHENLNDADVVHWYYDKLIMIAAFVREHQTNITFWHSFEWKNEDPAEEMMAAFIDFPQIIEDVGILRCKLGMFKTVACLQAVLLNKSDLDKLKEIGPKAFSNYLYPEEDEKHHFLSERHRSEIF